ncbi:RNA polymerase sigma-70 factor [Chitinophaga horti]|uniref:RNA polymerase sigma-70 factor n=1 Tax=Chitinophaga horti TaxID=2920382 RepID=A0ABY6IUI3_9BACT|nr:RNA polymerase sigma-70 factor [Chitinophaga horti]UYQ91020.1 RNA polymerase sigma-70 factor [Chitinophaga horti]
MHPPIENESALLLRVADGDRAAYAVLYRQYFPRLYNFIFFFSQSKEDAEEVIQECLLKVWERRDTLVGIRSFEQYVFRMAKNRLLDLTRRRMTGSRVVARIAENKPGMENYVDDEVLFKQYQGIAMDALSRLTEKKRTIFLMSAQRDMTLDEIATALGLSRAAVKKHLYAAIRQMKDYLKEHAEWSLILLLVAATN